MVEKREKRKDKRLDQRVTLGWIEVGVKVCAIVAIKSMSMSDVLRGSNGYNSGCLVRGRNSRCQDIRDCIEGMKDEETERIESDNEIGIEVDVR